MAGREEQLRRTARIAIPGTRGPELMEVYSQWQNSDLPYDQVAELRGYRGPQVTAEQLAEEVSMDKRSSYRVLDVGAGTGLVAEELNKLGFLNIDALEPSADMLRDAREKDVYSEYLQMFLTKEPLPIIDDNYDSVVTCGSFMENHIPLEALPELVRIVKPGGFIIITTRHKYLDVVEDYRGKFQPFLDYLENAGKWKQLEKAVFQKYYNQDDGIVWKYVVT